MENYLLANGYNCITPGLNISKSLASTTNWANPGNATGAPGNTDFPTFRNKTGFTGLPGGGRSYGGFSNNGEVAFWWSSTQYSTYTCGWIRNFYYDESNVSRSSKCGTDGFSVRCVKD